MTTGSELYSFCEVLINSGREANYYNAMIPGALNILLEEVRDCNNMLRIKAGKDAITSYPLVTSLNQAIDVEDTVARSILPYGLAGILLYEDSPTKATIYRNLFSYKVAYPTYCTVTAVRDCYGGGGAGL